MDYDGSVKVVIETETAPLEEGLKKAEKQVSDTAESMAKKVEDYAKKSEKALTDSLNALEAEAKAKGQTVSAQEKYNVYLKNYINLLTKSNGLIKAEHPLAQKRLEQLTKMRQEMEKVSRKGAGLNTVLSEAGVSAQGFTSKIAGAAQTGGPYVAAAVAAIAATKKLGETMRECSEYYKVQEKAERALETAAQNNPYIDGQAVAALKEFASELQSTSDIGDEMSIRLMAPLIAAGRTKEQIQAIMQASADIAASGAMPMESAIKNLNKTFGGLAGELGETIPEIKNLTKEQLENGDAVKIVAEQYKGMAKNLADTRVQAQNAKGDFKEMLGQLTAPAVETWDRFWKGFYETGTKALKWFKEQLSVSSIDGQAFLQEMLDRNQKGGEKKNAVRETIRTDPFSKTAMAKAIAQEEYTKENKINLSDSSTKELERLIALLNVKKSLSEDELQLQRDAIALLEQRKKAEQEAAEQAAANAKAEKEAAEAQAKREKEAQRLDEFLAEDKKRVQERIAALELEAKITGKAVDAQEVYNVYLQSYIDLLTKTDGKIKESYPVAQERIWQLEEAKKALDEQTEAEKRLQKAIEATQAVIKTITSMETNPAPRNALQQQIDQYQTIKSKIEALSEAEIAAAQKGSETVYTKQQLLEKLTEKETALESAKLQKLTDFNTSYFDSYKKQQEELLALKQSIDASEVLSHEQKAQAQLAIDEQYARNKAALAQKVFSQINEYTQQAAQIAQDAGNLMLEYAKNEQKIELAQLNERYEKGEIAETEYTEKSLAIKKKAARKEYQIRMFQWTASLLAAIANIAEGVSKAIAQGGVAGLITGALVGMAGGVQIASITASKPVPPAFEHGGIVPGVSYSGDHVHALVNSGEMIANFPQQKRLWAMLNGKEQYKPSFPVTVNNTQSNRVNTEVHEQNGALFIDILDKHINKGLLDGSYDAGFSGMQSRQAGVSIV